MTVVTAFMLGAFTGAALGFILCAMLTIGQLADWQGRDLR